MIFKLFSIYDAGTQTFHPPFALAHEGEALRQLQQMANDPDSKLYQWAEDFSLWRIGEFDDTDAGFDLETAPTRIASALDYKTTNRQPTEPVQSPKLEAVDDN